MLLEAAAQLVAVRAVAHETQQVEVSLGKTLNLVVHSVFCLVVCRFG